MPNQVGKLCKFQGVRGSDMHPQEWKFQGDGGGVFIVKETVSCGFDRIAKLDTTSNDFLRADVENNFRCFYCIHRAKKAI